MKIHIDKKSSFKLSKSVRKQKGNDFIFDCVNQLDY